ncbi:preprotein translocase subunit SecA [Tuwongella immobilis]|uniref:Protein translocase subunit SecA n=1 Tax=Tuwongella immobilis TaxID=692036 RepID=A0A6C2YTJ0_9BACT|nr:preprotein translocase subunit SecA [Tuwongella immobilis]VIP04701.1 preprotein translocase subunit : Protein translocase subunit SecA OS=uncultured planctomycete GN=secA PE=3 SV=1: SecA_DEAD: SecA_PP_bind [Tuwongella immobilis]VTS06761.1 preprotein translocase subunit : Protein translocase subunit SecA OS=uncultured planctomycete GN=secA PE=3 SV=1: SecA_DEAD: SecA_PP_bind [Tuwongella immobilis]
MNIAVEAEVLNDLSEARLAPPVATDSGRLGPLWMNQLRSVTSMPWKRRLAKAAVLIPQIRYWEQQYGKISDAEIRRTANALRGRARGGEKLTKLVPEAFGLGCVAVWRTMGYQPFDVQLAAGIIMHEGGLVELATGEGKTLTATMPTFLNALVGKGVHVATVNDYLAKRDSDIMTPLFERLGLSVGVLQQKMDDESRRVQYRRDITYGTASEFGFDFLRDRLKLRGGQMNQTPFWNAWLGHGAPAAADPRVQRELHYAIVDEADSIFIDEARTPLIISNPTRPATPEESVVYVWADKVAKQMQPDVHFTLNLKKDKIELTEAGKQLIRYSNAPAGEHSHAMDKLHEQIEKSLHAHFRFTLDHHYMIIEKKVVIVDESTGRPMPDRQWRDGLHQAVEAKEGVPITMAASHAAQITYQNFFKLYAKLAGMSGTLMPNFKEMRRVYKRWVTKVPTNKPVIRTQELDAVFPTEDAKFDAIVQAVSDICKTGRPILIGTRSVEKSERLSAKLTAAGIEHLVLNARQNEQEAQIISRAGQMNAVTVATNMAGRGTDIKLGAGVAELGGLHVIGTERHEAMRVDRQLLGRAGRQGDPGSGQFFLSLEDQLLESLGLNRQAALVELGRRGGNRDWNAFRKLFHLAQRKLERKHYRQRLDLMFHDRFRQEMLADLGADPFVD